MNQGAYQQGAIAQPQQGSQNPYAALKFPAVQQRQGREQRELSMKFRVLKIVGKGSYGSVYQVQRLDDQQIYALKEMDLRSMNQAEREDAANEIRLMASVQHPNVISYNEAFLDGHRLCIIMDFAPHGDLAGVIKNYSLARRHIPEDLLWVYLIQVCNGLRALHSMRVLHRDVKPGNVMLFANNLAKVGDLGIAKVLSKQAAAQTQIGTPHYMPPEIWKNQPYSYSSDSWAVGCLMYEMMTFRVPFEARNVNELRFKVLRGAYARLPSAYSADLQQVVCSCLDQVPERRPTMEGILTCRGAQARMHLVPVPQQAHSDFLSSDNIMLETIRVPRNIQMIKGKLPPANYRTSTTGTGYSRTSGYGGESRADVGRSEYASAPAALLPAIAAQAGQQPRDREREREGERERYQRQQEQQESPVPPQQPWEAVQRPRPKAGQEQQQQQQPPPEPSTPPAAQPQPRRARPAGGVDADGRSGDGAGPSAGERQQQYQQQQQQQPGAKKYLSVENAYKAYNQKRPAPLLAAGQRRPRADAVPPGGAGAGAPPQSGGGGGGGLARTPSGGVPGAPPRQLPPGVSESRAQYGAFYVQPGKGEQAAQQQQQQQQGAGGGAELAAQARARYDEVMQQHRLKGYYPPSAQPQGQAQGQFKGYYNPADGGHHAAANPYLQGQPQHVIHKVAGISYKTPVRKPSIADDDYF